MKKPKKIIHVARQQIACNLKNNINEPVIIVRKGNKSQRFKYVKVFGEVDIIQSDKPLPCGARVWIETRENVFCTNSPFMECLPKEITIL